MYHFFHRTFQRFVSEHELVFSRNLLQLRCVVRMSPAAGVIFILLTIFKVAHC